jgi:hypothetical protein
MQGFKKSKAFEQIRIPMVVKTASDDGNTIEDAEVAHIFRIPTPEVREEYQRKLLIVKNRKVQQGSRSAASWFLWLNSVLSVEGYLDLPSVDDQGGWKKYFNDPIGRIHVDNAVDKLMETLGYEEVDQEKKFEPSSEESS